MEDEIFKKILQTQEDIQKEITKLSDIAFKKDKVKYITLDMTRVVTEKTVMTDEIYWKLITNIKQKQNNINKLKTISNQMLKDIEADKKILKKYVKEHRHCDGHKTKCTEPHNKPDSDFK